MSRRRGIMSESFKYELAKDLGFYDVVQREGWEGIRTKDAGNMVKRAIQIAEEQLAKQYTASAPSINQSQSSYSQPNYNQPSYNQTSYSSSNYNQSAYSAGQTQQSYAQPGFSQSGYGGTQQSSYSPAYTPNANNTNMSNFTPSYLNQPHPAIWNQATSGSQQAARPEQRPY
ncbi:small acid-soluble spore protein F (minor alpha/beta-type SASP) [Paenibacillus sp. yr247]|nr:small acid-soluble spore protein F (minor alpha/beta-type SASP) [Paenibacillus sp. yr247]